MYDDFLYCFLCTSKLFTQLQQYCSLSGPQRSWRRGLSPEETEDYCPLGRETDDLVLPDTFSIPASQHWFPSRLESICSAHVKEMFFLPPCERQPVPHRCGTSRPSAVTDRGLMGNFTIAVCKTHAAAAVQVLNYLTRKMQYC